MPPAGSSGRAPGQEVWGLFLASRQAWPKILEGEVSMFGVKFLPKRSLDKTVGGRTDGQATITWSTIVDHGNYTTQHKIYT